MTETITIRCSCGRFLRGTIERKPSELFTSQRFDQIKITASQVITVCPGCRQIASTPIELTTAPVYQCI